MNAHQTALITGASSGIGKELARIFGAHGWNLVLVSRNENELRSLAAELEEEHGRTCSFIALDLAVPSAPVELHKTITDRGITIDALVNNAGFGTHGAFAEIDIQIELEMVRLNAASIMHITKLFLPGMMQRKTGRILNVASTAAFQPGPLMAVYYASKAFVLSFSEALSSELKGSGVTVTTLCPGPTATNFQSAAKMTDVKLMRGLLPMMSARAVAETGYRAMMKGRRVIVPGLVNKLGVFGSWLGPKGAVMSMIKYLHGKNG